MTFDEFHSIWMLQKLKKIKRMENFKIQALRNVVKENSYEKLEKFQETLKPQSDSPTVSKELFKILMAVAANSNFKLASVDIRNAFLQSRTLDRDVFMLPPPDIRKQGIICRLKKPIYGLDDTSCKFWL